MKKLLTVAALVLALALCIGLIACGETVCSHNDANTDGKCDTCGEVVGNCAHEDSEDDNVLCDKCGTNLWAAYEPITVADAIAIAQQAGQTATTERYYIAVKVDSIINASYGQMKVSDETGSIEVYGSYGFDGVDRYPDLENRPVAGDWALLYCSLNEYNGTPQAKSAWIIDYSTVKVEFDLSDYTEVSVAGARDAATGAKVTFDGVVAAITYANGKIPSGVILVDETSSIYVYDRDIAGQVKVGNKISVAGSKTYWILDTEQSNAEKFGYKGCNQIESPILLENDKGNHEFDKSWITETTVKNIMDTPATEDITTLVYKVTALVKRVDGTGFINYYIDDIDGKTGSYVYTQCNGGDFEWLDEFDGKFCTVYLTAINAKSTASGCGWRFLPVAVIDEGYTFNVNNAPEYAVTYHGLTQFLNNYTGDPAIALETLVSSELLGFEGATLTYSSSDENVIYFTNEDGVVTFHAKDAGTATVTVTSTHNGNTYSATIDITIEENVEVDYITVAEAIATPKDTDVVVKGIVGPSLVNKDGFYLFGEDGSMIAVLISKDAFQGLAIGHEIVVSGMRERYIKDDSYETYGQDAIVNGQIIANYYGNHEYSTEKFITGKTLAEIGALDHTESHSTEVYIVTGVTVEVVETANYTNINIKDASGTLGLYCSGAGQYSFLKAFVGQEITIEIAPCNWNNKTYYRGCVLSVILADGTKIHNTLNFTA